MEPDKRNFSVDLKCCQQIKLIRRVLGLFDQYQIEFNVTPLHSHFDFCTSSVMKSIAILLFIAVFSIGYVVGGNIPRSHYIATVPYHRQLTNFACRSFVPRGELLLQPPLIFSINSLFI
jgi:hypothetical protein